VHGAVPGVPAKGGWTRDARTGELAATFVGIERTMREPLDWTPPDAPALWVYHLHYFDDLPSSSTCAAPGPSAELVASWLDSNPPAEGPGWDPYPTSRRIANWTRWVFENGPDDVLRERMLGSLAAQARHLERTLEYHLQGNHLLTNAKGLVAAGLLFSGDEGERWLDRGLSLLERELDYQVLDDGGHIERSPMYHAIALGDVLDLLNLFQSSGEARSVANILADGATPMLDWLAVMTHPDGGPAFFNDTALDSAPTLGELAAYAHRLGVRWRPPRFSAIRFLDPSGYARLASGDGRTVALFDAAGPIGPNEQPGHGHCDALSFEVSRDGRRVIVNSGISTYERTPHRLVERSTAAHSTVRIDGEEQSEIWASHRVGRRAAPIRSGVDGERAYGAHDGYSHLSGRPVHERSLRLTEDSLVVADAFEGSGEHGLEWFFHLHPDLSAVVEEGVVVAKRDSRAVARFEFPPGFEVRVVEGMWHPSFNASSENRLIQARTVVRLPHACEVVIRWLD
jgi:uncharacterized heparinase superfamily protein